MPHARQRLGQAAEDLAVQRLEADGYRIVARNARTRLGELDIVALDGETLVFAEVKTCRLGKGRPWDNLHERKRSQVRRMAGVWLHDVPQRPRFWTIRCDAIGVVLDDRGALVRLDHLEDAF